MFRRKGLLSSAGRSVVAAVIAGSGRHFGGAADGGRRLNRSGRQRRVVGCAVQRRHRCQRAPPALSSRRECRRPRNHGNDDRDDGGRDRRPAAARCLLRLLRLTARRPLIMDRRSTATVPITAAASIDTTPTRTTLGPAADRATDVKVQRSPLPATDGLRFGRPWGDPPANTVRENKMHRRQALI